MWKRIIVWLSHCWLKAKEDLALEHSRHAVELNPLDPRFRRLYAFLLDIQGEEEKAYEQLKLAYRLAPRDSKLLFELSQRRRLAGHLFQALEYLELASEVDPENPLYHERLSDLYEQLGQTERAGEEAKRESDLRQAFEKYITAMSLAVNGKRVEAIAILEPVVQGPSGVRHGNDALSPTSIRNSASRATLSTSI